MATPIGVLGGIRGVFFFGIGAARFNDQPFTFSTSKAEQVQPVVDYTFDPIAGFLPIYGQPVTVDGFRLKDGRASYGIGLETFALGFPIHFDWSWKTTFNRAWEDALYAIAGGSSAFRKAKFSVWIGYDF
jgi:hypothetical protein